MWNEKYRIRRSKIFERALHTLRFVSNCSTAILNDTCPKVSQAHLTVHTSPMVTDDFYRPVGSVQRLEGVAAS